MELLKLFICS